MSKRISIESRVVEFFETAPLPTADAIFGVVAAKMKARRATITFEGKTIEGKHYSPKRRRKAKAPPVVDAGAHDQGTSA